MKAHRKLALACLLVTSVTSCNNKSPEEDNITANITKMNLEEIVYEKSMQTQNIKNGKMILQMDPVTSYEVNETVKITTVLSKALEKGHSYAYYIADWGDGTWSYEGPRSATEEAKSTMELAHQYKKAGTYKVKTAAVDLSSGNLTGWSNEETVTIVNGSLKDDNRIIDNVVAIASSNKNEAKNVLDNSSAYWTCNQASDAEEQEYIGMLFDKVYSLSKLEVKFPKVQDEFACNIAVEYTTDGGNTWYSLPKYYYLYDYSVGRYTPIMRFPNPKGATLVFDLDNICANGIRFTSKLFLSEERIFSVEEMRAYGSEKTLFYTSKGETYDADINNMWKVFGSAETEPIVKGSLYGEATNASPFRTGFAMIGSTEWLEWNGLKINWYEYPELQEQYLSQLLNTKYGADGWSDYEGYIYATASAAQHLNLANHYVYNSIFIIALRNYLLQGNDTTIETEDGIINIMDHVNGSGQKMSDRLEKAMSYMLTALEGETGVLTINDPRNDGTTSGVSSNYWDTHRSFGYKSSYENIFFYASILAMKDIKIYQGNATEAAYYQKLANKTKEEFNKLFWDASKGRYINSINVDGVRIDTGMTVVNFMACKYGLASDEQAKLIYSWIDGSRIIEGDTSTGSDIYDEYIYSARTNTVDMSNVTDSKGKYYWFDHGGDLPCTPGTFGGYGHQMQNGGTIFYISYYDMVGRINTNNVETAKDRFDTILQEFHKDSLRRDRYMVFTQNGTTGIGEYSEGVIGEFPESGLVPYTFLEGFLGIKVSAMGLEIAPNLPSDLDYAGVREYKFSNHTYSIQVSKQIEEPIVKKTDDIIFVSIPANSKYYITTDGKLIKG